MVYGLPALGETGWKPKLDASIEAVKQTAEAAQFALFCPPPSGGDDRIAIQSVVDQAAAGQSVVLRAGTYLVSLAAHPATAGYSAAIVLPPGVRLVGAGRGATVIKLIAGQSVGIDTQGVAVIVNRTLAGGDEDIEISDLTVDGDGANQTKLHNGIMFVRTRGCKISRVRVKNIKGTANFPPNETFHFETQLGMDTSYIDCEAIGDAGTQGSGFSADNATGVFYVNCLARGMSAGMGFTHYQCETVTYAACRAYANGSHGFNSEESRDVSYAGCHSGGEVATGTTPYPLAAGTSLGNAGSGFVVNGTRDALITSSTARRNAQAGITLTEGTNGASGRIAASVFAENDRGLSCSTAQTLPRWFLDPSTRVAGNTTAQFDIPGSLGGYVSGPGFQISPTIAQGGDGVAVANPFPWRASVYIISGTPTLLRVNGADVATDTRHIVLDPGMTITAWGTYSWLWFAI